MRALLPSPPQVPQLPWRAVAGACESAFEAVHRTVCDEFERNARFHAELEFGSEKNRKPLSTLTPEECAQDPSFSMPGSFSPESSETLPTIIVTPCPDEPLPSQRRRCFVPLQDAAFGDRLCVPAQPTVNEVFPPLVHAKRGSAGCIKRWEYSGGHWRAVPSSLEEQARRGLVARSLSQRRRRPATGR
ncbi:hypothetical protein PENSPDRAFT_686135 [Peniophora sp. CONT]|nr:hypothetical protein PENSPDRAFT_686135 [Peniophora sp. CONT]